MGDKFKIIHFIENGAPMFLGHETPDATNRRHVKERLGLAEDEITSKIVWRDDFPGNNYHYEFTVSLAVAARLEKEQAGNRAVRIVTPGSEPSFRWSSGFDDDFDDGDFGFAKPVGKNKGPGF